VLAHGRAVLGLERHQGPGDAEPNGAGGPVHAATLGGDDDVPLLVHVQDGEGLLNDHLADGVGEELGEGAIVDDALAGAGLDDDPRDGGFAAAGGSNGILGCDGGILL